MPDTIRSRADLVALFPSGTDGAISAQDLRDFLASALGCYGMLSVTDGAVAQTLIAATPAKLACWDTEGPAAGVVANDATDDLVVPVAGDYAVDFAASHTVSGPAAVRFAIRANDVELPGAAAAEEGRIATIVTLAAGAAITVWVEADAGVDITVTNGQLRARLIG